LKRYDHFLAPCDLLPQAIPSLIHCLTAAKLGQVDQATASNISADLGCNRPIPVRPNSFFDTSMQCSFPGHEVYEAILPISSTLQTLENNIEFANKYITPISINNNYVHVARAEESLQRLENSYQALMYLRQNFIDACQKYYLNDTVAEWLEVYITPHLNNLYEYLKATKSVMKGKLTVHALAFYLQNNLKNFLNFKNGSGTHVHCQLRRSIFLNAWIKKLPTYFRYAEIHLNSTFFIY
jgi:hypothetical protein